MFAPLLLILLLTTATNSTSFPMNYNGPNNYFASPDSRPSNFFAGFKNNNNNNNNNNNHYYYGNDGFFPYIFGRRFDPRVPLTCTDYPKMCNMPWSPGSDCCRSRCVNTRMDFFNCGRCGQMCRFGQICCAGQCVDVMFNKDHCGWCQQSCSQGATCMYGMCSYA